MNLIYKPSKRFAEYVAKIMSCGHWEDAGDLRGSHIALLRHIKSGTTVTYQLHDGGNDHNSPRNMASDAQAVCGCVFIEPRGRKRSRKAVQSSGFDPSRAARENARWADKWGGSVADLWLEHDRQAGLLCELAKNPTRSSASEASKALAEIRAIEAQLTRFGQPVQPFSITDLEAS